MKNLNKEFDPNNFSSYYLNRNTKPAVPVKARFKTMPMLPVNIGAVQGLKISPLVTLDQDGNKYASAEAKHDFLMRCFEQRIRSGNLQPITTVNQTRDLVRRINDAAAACGRPAMEAQAVFQAESEAAEMEGTHKLRMTVYLKMENVLVPCWYSPGVRRQNGSEIWAKIYRMTITELEDYARA